MTIARIKAFEPGEFGTLELRNRMIHDVTRDLGRAASQTRKAGFYAASFKSRIAITLAGGSLR